MEKKQTSSQRALDLVGRALRGLLGVLGWLIQEAGVTIRLFGISPMFFELVLAIMLTVIVVFPHEETKRSIAFAGTELAIPFVLGLVYSLWNTIWVATHEKDRSWYWPLAKASVFPVGLAWAIFSNRAFQEVIGWGDPDRTIRFCVVLVWFVAIANVWAVQMKVAPRRNSKIFLAFLVAVLLLVGWLFVGRQGEPQAVSVDEQAVLVEEQMVEEVVPILRLETSLARPEPMGTFYSTNYPRDVSVEVLANVICEYAHYMWPETLVTLDDCEMIVEENRKENVHPLWPSAIADKESHHGAYPPAYEAGNLWGIDMSGVDAGLTKFDSLQEGAQYVSWLLARKYFDQGLLTFRSVEEKYASHINPPNGAWAARVKDFYQDLGAELAQQTDPSAPIGIPVREEDGPRLTHVYSPAHTGHLHLGMDFGANPGPVWLHSTLQGKVVYAGYIPNLSSFAITLTGSADGSSYSVKELDVTGWVVVIENENWQTLYAHGAGEPLVAVGETVERGDRLMLMGATGFVTGRHVHYGIRYRLPSGEWRFIKP